MGQTMKAFVMKQIGQVGRDERAAISAHEVRTTHRQDALVGAHLPTAAHHTPWLEPSEKRTNTHVRRHERRLM